MRSRVVTVSEGVSTESAGQLRLLNVRVQVDHTGMIDQSTDEPTGTALSVFIGAV